MPAQTIGCFSYLASVHTLNVDHQPALNAGTVINSQDRCLAGDGPLVAGMLARFGHHASLAANHPSGDAAGLILLNTLRAWNVRLIPGPPIPLVTRTNIVACDRHGNRTWYGALAGLADELAATDIRTLTSNDVVYVDAYDVLGDLPERIVDAATAAGRYVVVNLGGCPIPDWLRELPRRVNILQTNGPDGDPAAAQALLKELAALNAATFTAVTAGGSGAYAQHRSGRRWHAPAIPVEVRHPQGAGAAFSASLIHTRRFRDTIDARLHLACAAGSLWCTRGAGDLLPTPRDIESFKRQRGPGRGSP